MASAALGQLALTAIGVMLIWRTLIYTRKAADAAQAAVDEAKAAVDEAKAAVDEAKAAVDEAKAATRAADAAVAVTRDTAQRQLRAYVFVENILLTDEGGDGSSHALLKIRNTGQTPAYRLKSHVQIEFDPDRRASFDPHRLIDNDSKAVIMDIGGGNMRGRMHTRKARDFDDKMALRSIDTYAHVFGRISYLDCFNAERKGIFHFVGHVNARASGGFDMDHADKGNEYD